MVWVTHNAHPASTWSYAWVVRAGRSVKVRITHNHRLRRSTLRITYVPDETTQEEIANALRDSGVPCEIHDGAVVVYTAR